jgi:hypothetical protein
MNYVADGNVKTPSPKVLWLCVFLFLVAISVFAVIKFNKSSSLFEKPPESGGVASFETVPSKLGVLVKVPMDHLSSLVDSNIPKTFSDGGNGNNACKDMPLGIPDVCVGTKYNFSANRGAVTLTSVDESTIRMELPISFSGQGGFRGAGAELLDVGAKNFNGALLLKVDFKPKINENWCPELNTTMSYEWTSNPTVEIVGGVNVDVKGQVESKFQNKLSDIASKVNGVVDCQKFHNALATAYGSKTFPVNIPSIGDFHINIKPTGIGFSGVKVDSVLVKIATIITANIEAGIAPLVPESIPLPNLQSIDAVPPRMSISLPMRIPYDKLSSVIAESLKNKIFKHETPAGKISVKINGAEVYPSNDKIVLGLDISADMPNSFFDTKGMVYFSATPKIEDGLKITLIDGSYSQVLDNAFWSVAAIVFEEQIHAEISKVATYNLSKDIDIAKEALEKKLYDLPANSAIKILLSDIDMKVGRLAVAEKELAVEGLFSATATIEPNI